MPSQRGEGRVIIGEWLVCVVVREAGYGGPRAPGTILRPSVILSLSLGDVHWHLAGVVTIPLGSMVQIQGGMLRGLVNYI